MRDIPFLDMLPETPAERNSSSVFDAFTIASVACSVMSFLITFTVTFVLGIFALSNDVVPIACKYQVIKDS